MHYLRNVCCAHVAEETIIYYCYWMRSILPLDLPRERLMFLNLSLSLRAISREHSISSVQCNRELIHRAPSAKMAAVFRQARYHITCNGACMQINVVHRSLHITGTLASLNWILR